MSRVRAGREGVVVGQRIAVAIPGDELEEAVQVLAARAEPLDDARQEDGADGVADRRVLLGLAVRAQLRSAFAVEAVGAGAQRRRRACVGDGGVEEEVGGRALEVLRDDVLGGV